MRATSTIATSIVILIVNQSFQCSSKHHSIVLSPVKSYDNSKFHANNENYPNKYFNDAEKSDFIEIIGSISENIGITSTGNVASQISPRMGSSSDSSSNSIRKELNDFSTRDSRLGFIRKVYSIFASQIVMTAIVTTIIISNTELSTFLQHHASIISLMAFFSTLSIVSLFVTTPALSQSFPTNFALLALHTLGQSIMVGTFASLFDPSSVLLGAMHSLTVFLGITLYSFQPNPKFDLTLQGYGLLSLLISTVVGSILNVFFRIPVLEQLISVALAIVSGLYIMYDTQMIVGGNHHKHRYKPNEYILAAMNLYQDAINLFMQLLKLLGKQKKNE